MLFILCSAVKSLPLLPHRTDILSGMEVALPLRVPSPEAPTLRQSLPALCAFPKDSAVELLHRFKVSHITEVTEIIPLSRFPPLFMSALQ